MPQISIETLKSEPITDETFLPLIQALANWRGDKGYAAAVLDYWLKQQQRRGETGTLETLLGRFLMRQSYDVNSPRLHLAIGASLYGEPVQTYRGTYEENTRIDGAVAELDDHAGYRDRIRHGAARFFSLERFHVPTWAGARTPIVILGAGAAGTLVARLLSDAGYQNLCVIDAAGTYGGIWRQEQVQFTRNNPFAFNYEDVRVEAAPGSGRAIISFVEQLAAPSVSRSMRPLPPVLQGTVMQVKPGDLEHEVLYQDRYQEFHALKTPILINALGLGAPLPLSRPGVIETDVADHQGGLRWQHPISRQEAEALRGKCVALIGLGNSTMEMVVQLQKLNDAGYHIAYKIITHYSREALRQPMSTDHQGKRLYRNITFPDLSRLAGDLDYVNTAFQRARGGETDQEEVLAEVCHWTIESDYEGLNMVVAQRNGTVRRFAFHWLYTLIGYGHQPEHLRSMGITVAGETAPVRVAHDYDGEFQTHDPLASGRDRLYPGYFGFGAMLSSPNALVIPGMLYRLPDLLVGVTMRATEHVLKSRQKKMR